MRFRNLKKQSKKLKEQDSLEAVKVASIPERIKAFITDMFMIYTPILYILTYLVLGDKDAFQASDVAPFAGVVLYGLIYTFLVHRFAQTPGHKAYQIKVVDASTHKNLTIFQALLRFVGFLVSATILFGLLLPFYRKDKATLHDLLAHTITIKDTDAN